MLNKAHNLLQHCIKTNNWEPESDSQPIVAFSSKLRKDKLLKSKWYPEAIYLVILRVLAKYKGKKSQDIDTTTCKQFVHDIRAHNKSGISKHIILIPIPHATLKNNDVISFNGFSLIPGSFSKKEKLDCLSKMVGSSFSKLVHQAEHTERTRSPDFYKCALLCIKVSHHTEWIRDNARRIALWNIAFLKALSCHLEEYGKILLTYTNYHIQIKHLYILSHQDWRCSHVPLQFDPSCSCALDFLSNKECQKQLVKLNRLLVFSSPLDRLSFRFYRSFRLFNKAIDFSESKEAFDGFGLTILFLMIAAEGVLLNGESGKRFRLSCLIPKLGCSPKTLRKKGLEAVDSCYRWRSDFVHSGTDQFPDYDEHFKKGEISSKVNLLRKMVATILLQFPKYAIIANKRAKVKPLRTNSATKTAMEDEWFTYLDALWKKSFSV